MRALTVASMLSMALTGCPEPAATHGTAPPPPAPPVQEKFSLAIFPDTQYSADSYPEVFEAQGRWVAENKDKRRIAYGIHTGDVVDDSGDDEQWSNARRAMAPLDGKLPYIVGVGNHDMDAMSDGGDPEKDRDADAFNENFPVSRFSGLPSFGGSLPEGRNDNSFHTFRAGGTDWLVLALKFAPTDEEIAWGNTVIADHPRHQVMIATHGYQKGTEKDHTGRQLWSELVRKHRNVSFVFSGHHHTQGVIEEKGEHGNTVYQVQADYQESGKRDPNSYLRMMEFDPKAKKVSVQTYSPFLKKNLTDEENQFTIDGVDFMPAA